MRLVWWRTGSSWASSVWCTCVRPSLASGHSSCLRVESVRKARSVAQRSQPHPPGTAIDQSSSPRAGRARRARSCRSVWCARASRPAAPARRRRGRPHRGAQHFDHAREQCSVVVHAQSSHSFVAKVVGADHGRGREKAEYGWGQVAQRGFPAARREGVARSVHLGVEPPPRVLQQQTPGQRAVGGVHGVHCCAELRQRGGPGAAVAGRLGHRRRRPADQPASSAVVHCSPYRSTRATISTALPGVTIATSKGCEQGRRQRRVIERRRDTQHLGGDADAAARHRRRRPRTAPVSPPSHGRRRRRRHGPLPKPFHRPVGRGLGPHGEGPRRAATRRPRRGGTSGPSCCRSCPCSPRTPRHRAAVPPTVSSSTPRVR